MQAVSNPWNLVLAMDMSTVMNFKTGAFFFFLAFFVVVFWRVATRKEGFYHHDATILLEEDSAIDTHKGVPHE